MEKMFQEIRSCLHTLVKIVLSAPGSKNASGPERITLQKRIDRSGTALFSAEEKVGPKAFHKNLTPEDTLLYLQNALEESGFRQINLFSETGEVSFRISKKGKIARSANTKARVSDPQIGHNREKAYLVREGDRIPVLVELGIFTREYKIVQAKYDKFRQINRFLEILDHAFRDYPKEEIQVLDFGCGKSYLSFLVYYYFSVLQKKKVHITGYDLKEDVVEHCNALVEKYGYHGMRFVVADVTRDVLSQETIDFVLSLHACDVATDFAIDFAISHKVPYLFSVPCCQHEVGSQIKKGGGDLDLFLDHGIFKERMSALVTDAMRTRILEAEGYRVDVLEFVDFAHSPKNIMLRAKRKENPEKKDLKPLLELEKTYGFRQTLLHLRKESE